jgi:hypothetical protein
MGTDKSAGMSDEDFGLQALCNDAAREEQVVEGEGGCPATGNGWIVVSLLDRSRRINGKVNQ